MLGEYLSSSTAGACGGKGDQSVSNKANAETDDEFMMYEFKVRWCTRAWNYDWTACPTRT